MGGLGSRRFPMVIPQQAANPFAALDLALCPANFLTWINQLIAQSLMVSLGVIMFQELADSGAKHLLAEENHFQETLSLDTFHEPFDVGFQVRRSRRQTDAS